MISYDWRYYSRIAARKQFWCLIPKVRIDAFKALADRPYKSYEALVNSLLPAGLIFDQLNNHKIFSRYFPMDSAGIWNLVNRTRLKFVLKNNKKGKTSEYKKLRAFVKKTGKKKLLNLIDELEKELFKWQEQWNLDRLWCATLANYQLSVWASDSDSLSKLNPSVPMSIPVKYLIKHSDKQNEEGRVTRMIRLPWHQRWLRHDPFGINPSYDEVPPEFWFYIKDGWRVYEGEHWMDAQKRLRSCFTRKALTKRLKDYKDRVETMVKKMNWKEIRFDHFEWLIERTIPETLSQTELAKKIIHSSTKEISKVENELQQFIGIEVLHKKGGRKRAGQKPEK